jgi:hypothetical protein
LLQKGISFTDFDLKDWDWFKKFHTQSTSCLILILISLDSQPDIRGSIAPDMCAKMADETYWAKANHVSKQCQAQAYLSDPATIQDASSECCLTTG